MYIIITEFVPTLGNARKRRIEAALDRCDVGWTGRPMTNDAA